MFRLNFYKTRQRANNILLASVAGVLVSVTGVSAQAANPAFHFESICRTDPAVNKNTVTVLLHGPDTLDLNGLYVQNHAPLAGVTVTALWTYVDYRQNHAVFKYRTDYCTTKADGSCTFNGGSGRARWQLAQVAGYDLSSPAFDTLPTTTCPNTTMIDFW